MSKKLKTFWIMKHWAGHVYPTTFRILRKDCRQAFYQDYGQWSDNKIHKPVKVTIHRAPHPMTRKNT